jgi:sarcosine oxidase
MAGRGYDAIVIGLGAMGRATLFHLALRGWRVLGLEQFAPGHTLGSSHGDSRIIREMYFEHPLYVPLVQRAYELWGELEARSSIAFMTLTGGLMIGPRDGSVVQGTLRSAAEHGLATEILDADETRARYPAFEFKSDDLVAVVDPRAGYLDPEACNKAHLDAATASGARAQFEEPVLDWSSVGDGVEVKTSVATYAAGHLVITAGPWTRRLARDTDLPLSVERQTVFWLEPGSDAIKYERSSFPIYAYEYKPGNICYGFPRLPRGVKASVMHGGETTDDPESVRRATDEGDVASLRAALRPVLPALAQAPIRESGTCLFTNTPDHDFVIDFHPLHRQVLVSTPCSGHGFKFASAIGELQADLLIDGKSRFDLSPFRIQRLLD